MSSEMAFVMEVRTQLARDAYIGTFSITPPRWCDATSWTCLGEWV